MTKKCKNKLIKNDDLVQVLQQFSWWFLRFPSVLSPFSPEPAPLFPARPSVREGCPASPAAPAPRRFPPVRSRPFRQQEAPEAFSLRPAAPLRPVQRQDF